VVSRSAIISSMNGEKPRIGITADEDMHTTQGTTLPGHVVRNIQAVRLAGGEPVVIEVPQNPESLSGRRELKEIFEKLSGIVFTGGPDINPELYGQIRRETTDKPSNNRDAAELYLMELTRKKQLPMLAICRGMQLWNVLEGGTLMQQIPGDSHRPKDKSITEHHHDVAVIGQSHLSTIVRSYIVSDSIKVNSFHHQAIDKRGDSLRLAAESHEGIVEAVETLRPGWFALGTQWHCETMGALGGEFYSALLEAAKPVALAAAA
jgi:gamma-glutamyl-gamma-aminobutyrate hydrolase PuuD